MAYFLATVARESVICFPLDVKHQSQAESGPDFWLTLAGPRVGVECVEAASQESYRIERMREIKYPEAFVFGQRFHPSDRRYSDDEREQIASGQMTGPPWMTGSAQKSWMATMDYFVARKVAKLAKGNYAGATETWLLIQDQWPTPLRFYPERVRDAANKLTDLLLKRGYGFDAVYILSGKQLLCIERGACVALPIVDLWAVEEA